MVQRFKTEQQFLPGGVLLILVGILLGYVQMAEYLRSGRVPVAWSSRHGATYGQPIYLLIPFAEILAGVWLALGAVVARFEISESGIAAFSRFGHSTSIAWADVKTFESDGTVTRPFGTRGTRQAKAYKIRSDRVEIRLFETQPIFSHLVAAIKAHLPASAVDTVDLRYH